MCIVGLVDQLLDGVYQSTLSGALQHTSYSSQLIYKLYVVSSVTFMVVSLK